MKKHLIVGVMGGSSASEKDKQMAYDLGRRIAQQGWILLSGGRNTGIMNASLKGAFEAGGTTLGILPDENMERASTYLTIPILTGMGQVRNLINALSSDVVVAFKGGPGTVSEICFALKYEKNVILMDTEIGQALEAVASEHQAHVALTPDEVVIKIKSLNLQTK